MLRSILTVSGVAATFLFVPKASGQASFAPMSTFGGGDGYLAPGDRTYLGTANNERGIAYNPSTNNVYLISRSTAPPSLAVLNGDTGAEQQVVSMTGLTEGTFLASQIRVADDGAIYVANLATPTSASQSFKVYRYANEAALLSNTSTIAYEGDVITGQRYGDNFNVRGSGVNTQLVAGSGANFANFAVFTTNDGSNFNATTYTLAGNGDAANGVAFGPGNTLYVKQVGEDLRLFSFTPNVANAQSQQAAFGTGLTGQTTLLGRLAAIDSDTTNNLLDGLSISTTTNDTALLYDISDPSALAQTDFENFPNPDNANSNVAGSVEIGNGRAYVLDTNNGLLAFTVTVPEPGAAALVGLLGAALVRRRHRHPRAQ